jgi:hypothetical protein
VQDSLRLCSVKLPRVRLFSFCSSMDLQESHLIEALIFLVVFHAHLAESKGKFFPKPSTNGVVRSGI